MASNEPPKRSLPFSAWWPIGCGAVAGIVLRASFFGGPGRPYSAMGLGFVLFAPIAVGAVTVYFGQLGPRRALGDHVARSILATLLFVVGAIAVQLEGWICAIIILPLFTALGVIGSLLMLLVCRLTKWARSTLSCIVALPLALGAFETTVALPDNLVAIERSVVVEAPAERVWRELIDARDIRAEEIDGAWLFRIGVPLPLEGQLLDGRGLQSPMPTRRVRMAKNVYFDEKVVEARPNELIRWTYEFYPDSFPPNALDDHVRVGGLYFDVRDTSYSLARRDEATVLTLRIDVRVSTRFNWYANPVARFLLGNLAEANLGYYKRRSEGGRG
jgi:uncharacterized protein YndB with AHSA1/START domain